MLPRSSTLGGAGHNYFYAMEFVEGETLENLVKRSGPLEVKLALEIATQVAAGLAAVHKQELVHRDIKPSNIMVSLEEEGAVVAKIIDLGLAKTVSEAGSQTDDFNIWRLCRDTGIRQSRTIWGSRCGYSFGSLLAWCFALADADRSCAIFGVRLLRYVSASARSLTA